MTIVGLKVNTMGGLVGDRVACVTSIVGMGVRAVVGEYVGLDVGGSLGDGVIAFVGDIVGKSVSE